jgi:hypothetical protein
MSVEELLGWYWGRALSYGGVFPITLGAILLVCIVLGFLNSRFNCDWAGALLYMLIAFTSVLVVIFAFIAFVVP